jgi:hypothetical protein
LQAGSRDRSVEGGEFAVELALEVALRTGRRGRDIAAGVGAARGLAAADSLEVVEEGGGVVAMDEGEGREAAAQRAAAQVDDGAAADVGDGDGGDAVADGDAGELELGGARVEAQGLGRRASGTSIASTLTRMVPRTRYSRVVRR